MNCLLLFVVFCLMTTRADTQQHQAQNPAEDRSPSGRYLLMGSRSGHPDENKHTMSIVRQDHPQKYYEVYSFPRLADFYFSPKETYLAVSDYVGSGACNCVLLQRTDKPPYYVNPRKVDETCWKLFWSTHKNPKGGVSYDHQSTYLCEWMDDAHFVVGLQGDNQIGPGRFYLEGGWHCIYDVKTSSAYTDKYTDSLNLSSKFELE